MGNHHQEPRIFYAPEAREFVFSSQNLLPHLELSREESHHAIHALRLRAGERVRLFDGAGFFYDASITSIGRHTP